MYQSKISQHYDADNRTVAHAVAEHDREAFFIAAETGDLAILQKLAEEKPLLLTAIDQEGTNALGRAIQWRRFGAAKFLLTRRPAMMTEGVPARSIENHMHEHIVNNSHTARVLSEVGNHDEFEQLLMGFAPLAVDPVAGQLGAEYVRYDVVSQGGVLRHLEEIDAQLREIDIQKLKGTQLGALRALSNHIHTLHRIGDSIASDVAEESHLHIVRNPDGTTDIQTERGLRNSEEANLQKFFAVALDFAKEFPKSPINSSLLNLEQRLVTNPPAAMPLFESTKLVAHFLDGKQA